MSFFQKKIHYISDGANWVIKEIGESLNRELKDEGFELKESSLFCLNGINHFSSRYSAKKMFIKSPFVKNILTYFHGEDSDIKIINAIKKISIISRLFILHARSLKSILFVAG